MRTAAKVRSDHGLTEGIFLFGPARDSWRSLRPDLSTSAGQSIGGAVENRDTSAVVSAELWVADGQVTEPVPSKLPMAREVLVVPRW